MYLVLVFLPLFSFITAAGFGRFIGAEGAKRITTSCIFVTFLLSCFAFYEVALAGSPTYVTTITWMDSEMFHCSWGFLFDSLTVVMLVVVTCVFNSSTFILNRVYGRRSTLTSFHVIFISFHFLHAYLSDCR
jgi:NADH-ubiquinone oxidoreductase chain 5